ncbi:helix-turn-helix domain-containing protein [Actinoplanes sp. NPDC051494]|uniref:helix-turn-helix domain-containing protein n=1 Tax=Actinoplanes sp. NPDC051494 TaxID=3363907 RepID=UPI00378F32B7
MVAESASLGGRLLAYRRRRRMSQHDLATASGVSVDVIRKLEQGRRHSARLETLTALAHALDAQPAELLGKPRGLAYGAEDSELLQLRRAVLGLLPVDGPVLQIGDLQNALARSWQLYWSGTYPVLARDLPGLLGAARVTASSSTVADLPAARTVLAELLQITASLLAHLAHEDLAHLALHGARHAAEAADDELLSASMLATRSWILSRQGLWSEAEDVAVRAAAEVEPVLSVASPDQVAVWGELLRYAAVALSRSGRHSEAAETITLMNTAAARLGGDRATRYTGVSFGPMVVAMRAVDAAISAGKPRKALQLAVRVEHPEHMPPAMHMRYLLNVAWAQTLDWHSGDAVATVLRAERVAPQSLPHQGIARAIVAELLPRRRAQRLPGLAPLAERMNITV